jgi:hypothetical protein
MTKAEVQALIDSKLASGTEIQASEHREVETALLNYLDSVIATAPVMRGTVSVGNVAAPVSTINVSFFPNPPLDTSDYIVAGSLVSLGDISADTTCFWTVRNKNQSGFSLIVRENGAFTQNLQFDYVVFRK